MSLGRGHRPSRTSSHWKSYERASADAPRTADETPTVKIPQKSLAFVVPIKGTLPPTMTLSFGFKVDEGPFVLERIVVEPPDDPWWWGLWALVWFMWSFAEHVWHWRHVAGDDDSRPWKLPAYMDPRLFRNLALNGIDQFRPGGLWVGTEREPSLSIFHPTADFVAFKFDTLWPGSEGSITIRNPTGKPMELRISLAGSIDRTKKQAA